MDTAAFPSGLFLSETDVDQLPPQTLQPRMLPSPAAPGRTLGGPGVTISLEPAREGSVPGGGRAAPLAWSPPALSSGTVDAGGAVAEQVPGLLCGPRLGCGRWLLGMDSS